MTLPKHLDSDCGNMSCETCEAPIKQEILPSGNLGGWFITIGHAGFNSPTNNRLGYKTHKAALAAFRKYKRM